MWDQPMPRLWILDKLRINIIMEPKHNQGNGFEAVVVVSATMPGRHAERGDQI